MKFYYDLHIHSALSPCGDNAMTPNNIINMSYIKGLKVISVTDHNSILNVKPIMNLGKKRDILVIPGMEVTTKEDVHVLCYFHDLKLAKKFSDIIYQGMAEINNSKELFGDQFIFDENDNVIGEEKKLLTISTKYSLKEIDKMTQQFNGVLIPSHINKRVNSIISVLGDIPGNLNLKTVELTSKEEEVSLNEKYCIKKFKKIYNSDAHYLKDINEPINFLSCNTLTIETILNTLK